MAAVEVFEDGQPVSDWATGLVFGLLMLVWAVVVGGLLWLLVTGTAAIV